MKEFISWVTNNKKISIPLIIWLILGLVAFITYVIIHKSVSWEVLTGCATWVLATGVGFAVWQIFITRENAEKSNYARLAVELFKELRSTETLTGIRMIYSLKPESFADLSKQARYQLEYVLDRFDMIGGLVVRGIVEGELAIEVYAGAPALRCWYQLCSGYIRPRQEDRGLYCENYELFTRLALDYYIRNDNKLWLTREGEENIRIDVIRELSREELRPRNLDEMKKPSEENP